MRLYRQRVPDEEYQEMLLAQNHQCAICGKAENKEHYFFRKSKRFFFIDHDHATRRIRGLLCVKCNAGLGFFGDNVEGLRRVLAYLERGQIVEAVQNDAN